MKKFIYFLLLAVISGTSFIAVAVDSEEKEEKKFYRWKDKNGKVHFSDTPPNDKDYEEKALSEKGINVNKMESVTPLELPNSPKQKKEDNKNVAEPVGLSLKCERSYNSLNDLEKKVSKQANPSASIWLHDYCSALSEMVTEQCNISRKVIKYNDYCPVRFRK